MHVQNDFATLIEDVLGAEIVVLTELYACQKRMYAAVIRRDWIIVEKEAACKETVADRFLALESKRIEIIQQFFPNLDGSSDFYLVTRGMSVPTRTHVSSLFREIKRLLILSKSENDAFNSYISNARTVLTGLLETVIPARRNKIYSQRGSLVSGCTESLVVNQSL